MGGTVTTIDAPGAMETDAVGIKNIIRMRHQSGTAGSLSPSADAGNTRRWYILVNTG